MNIAVLYICTGKYDIFWQKFHSTCEKHFYPGHNKEYFVLTDSKALFAVEDKGVHPYFQAKAGWPYDTLLRYNWFCMLQDILITYDLCYFFNANTEITGEINESILPFPTQDAPLILNIHSHMYEDCAGDAFHPERNPKSKAYIPEGAYCRAYSGGFWGGYSKNVMQMCCVLRDRIAEDMREGIVAVWHDQSHLQKYALETAHAVVSKDLVSSEEYAIADKCRIMFVDKTKYGGQDKLRELSFKERLHKLPISIYRKMLGIAKKMHMDGLLRRAVKLIVRK